MPRKKIHAKKKVKKKIHAEARSNCDFFRKSEFLSELWVSEINNITRYNMNKQKSLSSYWKETIGILFLF